MPRKILSLFGLFFFFNSISAFTQQENTFLLHKADSLFEIKRFTQSLDLYSELYRQNIYSPAMLLKMAYISEALKKKPETMYFLNAYYLSSGNQRTLTKMNEMAEKWEISGYEPDTNDIFYGFYYQYYNQIVLASFAFTALSFLLIIYLKKKNRTKTYAAGILFMMAITILFYLANYGSHYNKGVLFTDNVPAMAGPSPASKPLTRLHQGQRLVILKKNPDWTQIKWDGKPVYVRTHHIKTL
ncbi:MAG: hypothetical protein OEW75_01870 [Cyclobacteriaceae bacterium]|nr:hypothetical protein [Cyclobacteriaceae bacterium]